MENIRNSILVLLLFSSASAYGDAFSYYGQTTEVNPFINRPAFEQALSSLYTEDFTAPQNSLGTVVSSGPLVSECIPFGCVSFAGGAAIVKYGGAYGNALTGYNGSTIDSTRRIDIDHFLGKGFTAFGVDVLGLAPLDTIYLSFHDLNLPLISFTYAVTNSSDVTSDVFFGLTADSYIYNVQGWAVDSVGQPTSYWLDNMTFGDVATTPEPGSLLLFATGLICLFGAICRKLRLTRYFAGEDRVRAL